MLTKFETKSTNFITND